MQPPRTVLRAALMGTSFFLVGAPWWFVGVRPAAAAGAPGSELIHVPLRWCAVEGSPAEKDPGVLGEPDTDNVLWRRHERASDNIWIPGATITFRSAMTAEIRDRSHFPVIKDPDPPPPAGTGVGGLGDIVFEDGLGTPEELAKAIAACEEAWKRDFPDARGPIALNVRRFVSRSGIPSRVQGVANPPVTCNAVISEKACRDARSVAHAEGTWVAVWDRFFLPGMDPHDAVLAHELGHILFLGHGDGIDNDGDGVYDDCCDPLEDPEAEPRSLMHPRGGSESITTLQRGTSRALAQVSAGSATDPPAALIPGDTIGDQQMDTVGDVAESAIDIVWLSFQENPGQRSTLFTIKLLGDVLGTGTARYAIFADLDADPATGGNPSALGFATAFTGADLVVQVEVSHPGGFESVAARAWRFSSGLFAEVSDPRILAQVVRAVEAETGIVVFAFISAELPDEIRGPAAPRLRLQALAENPGATVSIRDRLPGQDDGGAVFIPAPPKYPVCSVLPGQAVAGATVAVEAAGLFPNRLTKVFLGDLMVGQGLTTPLGESRSVFRIPDNTRTGPRLVTVGIAGAAVTADCVVEVLPVPDCNHNGIDDRVDVASGTSPDVNGSGVPDECEQGSITWVFNGTAQGGQITTTIQGRSASCTVVVTTSAGQAAATVASNVAAAINADACLSAQGIQARAAAGQVVITGLDLRPDDLQDTVTDPGLQHAMVIPAVSPEGLAAMILTLLATALVLLRRRSRDLG